MKFVWLLGFSLVACGGRATVDASSTEGRADADAGLEMIGAGSLSSGGASQTSDAGPMSVGAQDAGAAHCRALPPVACTFVAVDRPDLPPQQRWGMLAAPQQLVIGDCTVCGDVEVVIDEAGCVDPSVNATTDPFAACVIRDLDPFEWPCAAGQKLRFFMSCGPK